MLGTELRTVQCGIEFRVIIVIFDGPAIYIITHKRAPLLNRRLVTNSILIDYAPETGPLAR